MKGKYHGDRETENLQRISRSGIEKQNGRHCNTLGGISRGFRRTTRRLGNWAEYGLDLSYIAPDVAEDRKRGYICFLLSTGGPHEEFRFYMDENLNVTHVDFHHMNWFDGAKIQVRGKHLATMTEIYNDWKETETIKYLIEKAVK